MKKLLLVLVILCICISCKGQTENKPETSAVTFEYLSDQELQSKSKEELRLIRNEIFARKGYVFKSNDLNQYFKTKSWYTPDANVKVSLSDEEQGYIEKIKSIENSNQKIHKCLDYFDKKVKDIYPLVGSENWNMGDFFDDYNEENYDRIDSITYKEGLSCDGFYIYNINCSIEVENILYTAYCNENPIFHILSIKGDEIIKKVKVVWSSLDEGEGSFSDGYYDIDFKLDHDDLEVYKIYKKQADTKNATKKEDLYKSVETGREVTKYKLTDTGLVEQ
jgi:hypothetical protein